MTGDQNKAIVRRFIEELWNQRNLDLADELFAADCVTHQLRSGAALAGVPRGPEAMKEHIAEWLAGFPDLSFTIEQMVAEGDQVVTRAVLRGMHRGVWLGIPPTKKQVSLRMITIHRIAGAKIVEDWVLLESLGFFQQLGLLPATREIVAQAAT